MPQNIQVGIVGAGLSGLICSYYLCQANISHTLFERSTFLGGRAREIQGNDRYFLDTGQHILSDSYLKLKKTLSAVHPQWKSKCHSFYPWDIKTKSGTSYFGNNEKEQLNFQALKQLGLWLLHVKNIHELKEHHVFKNFLRPFCLSIFALEPEQVPEKTLQSFLRKLLLYPKFYLPCISLSELLINPLYQTILSSGYATFCCSTSVMSIDSLDTKSIINTKKGQYRAQHLIIATSAQSLAHLFKTLPLISSCSIRSEYYQTSNKQKQIIINPCSEFEWEFFLPGKSCKVRSSQQPLAQSSIESCDSKKLLKTLNMKHAICNISCPNLPILKDKIKDLPYEFVGDYLDEMWPCTLESSALSAERVSKKIITKILSQKIAS